MILIFEGKSIVRLYFSQLFVFNIQEKNSDEKAKTKWNCILYIQVILSNALLWPTVFTSF